MKISRFSIFTLGSAVTVAAIAAVLGILLANFLSGAGSFLNSSFFVGLGVTLASTSIIFALIQYIQVYSEARMKSARQKQSLENAKQKYLIKFTIKFDGNVITIETNNLEEAENVLKLVKSYGAKLSSVEDELDATKEGGDDNISHALGQAIKEE